MPLLFQIGDILLQSGQIFSLLSPGFISPFQILRCINFLAHPLIKFIIGIRINDFRLYREITDGKSITCMIAGLNKEYGDVVESGLLFADPAVVDRETDELIEKAIAFKLAYRQQYQQKAGWNYEPSFC